jgi:3',5'-cyclic AMP phosphodiesterase CpdA
MPVRLLHMSDIHFGYENASAIEAAADYAAATPFDLLAVSGDITQYGKFNEFRSAAAWLASIPGPHLSTPGNHDTPWLGLFERMVMPFARYARTIGPPREASFEAPGLSVRAINSARGWQVRLNWSKGEISRKQAESASRRLEAAAPGDVRVLVCHHPLVEVQDAPMTARVRGGRFAAKRFAQANIDAVLTGHLHAPFVQVLPFDDERTYAIGASTLSLRERGATPGFNVIEIDGDQMAVNAMAWDGRILNVQRAWVVPLRPRGLRARPRADTTAEPHRRTSEATGAGAT